MKGFTDSLLLPPSLPPWPWLSGETPDKLRVVTFLPVSGTCLDTHRERERERERKRERERERERKREREKKRDDAFRRPVQAQVCGGLGEGCRV